MVDFPPDEQILADLLARAGRADWSGVRALADHPAVAGLLEAGLVVSEAELRQGETSRAKTRLQALLPEATRRHSDMALLRATNMLGAAHFELGELTEAETAFERALAEATRVGDHLTAARATNNLGMVANVQGRHQAALGHYRVAIPAYQRLGFASGLGETSHNIAITLRDTGQLVEAERQEQRAIEYGREAGNARLTAMARTGRADLALRTGEAAVAAAEARLAAEAFRGLPDPVSEADALRVLALAHAALGEAAKADQTIAAAVALVTAYPAPLIEAEVLRARAELAVRRGDRAAALPDVDQAALLFERVGAGPERAALLAWWAESGRST